MFPQGLNLGSLLFLAYVNNLPQGLRFNTKVFADGTSSFPTVTSPVISTSNLNEDLLKITQWKVSFNLRITKQAQEIIFSRKKNSTNDPSLYFNNARI